MKKKCPKCKTEMEYKFSLDDAEEDFSETRIYQCPNCKNIETI